MEIYWVQYDFKVSHVFAHQTWTGSTPWPGAPCQVDTIPLDLVRGDVVGKVSRLSRRVDSRLTSKRTLQLCLIKAKAVRRWFLKSSRKKKWMLVKLSIILFQSYFVRKGVTTRTCWFPNGITTRDPAWWWTMWMMAGSSNRSGERASENGRCGCVDGEVNFPKIQIAGQYCLSTPLLPLLQLRRCLAIILTTCLKAARRRDKPKTQQRRFFWRTAVLGFNDWNSCLLEQRLKKEQLGRPRYLFTIIYTYTFFLVTRKQPCRWCSDRFTQFQTFKWLNEIYTWASPTLTRVFFCGGVRGVEPLSSH